MNDEEKEAFMSEMSEKDPQVDRFRALNEHAPVLNMETAWISKVAGDSQQYTKGESTVSYAVNVVKSIKWPGAVTVCKGGKFTNVYVGYGIKRVDPSFNPTSPPEIDTEPMDPVEQPEPTPFNEPVIQADVPADDD